VGSHVVLSLRNDIVGESEYEVSDDLTVVTNAL